MMASEPAQHMMPNGTMMTDTAMAGQHVMPNGEVMSNADMAGQHVMPNGEIMNNAEMEPMGEPEPEPELDPFIEELCSAIEAGQTDEINAMTGWLADRGLEPEAPCAHVEESCDSCSAAPPRLSARTTPAAMVSSASMTFSRCSRSTVTAAETISMAGGRDGWKQGEAVTAAAASRSRHITRARYYLRS